jgi:hypothetical protein
LRSHAQPLLPLQMLQSCALLPPTTPAQALTEAPRHTHPPTHPPLTHPLLTHPPWIVE